MLIVTPLADLAVPTATPSEARGDQPGEEHGRLRLALQVAGSLHLGRLNCTRA
jgi:hypothetical protein